MREIIEGFNVQEEEKEKVYMTFLALYILRMAFDE